MKIIEEIIGELTNKDIHLTDVLIRTKVLAFKLKNNELKEWIDAELEGYTKNNIPEYRVLPCQITCTISNGFQRMQNYPIPLLGLDGKLKDLMTKMRLYQSISTLDDFVLDDSTNNTLSHYIPAEYYALLSRGFAHGVIVEFAQRFIDRVQVIQVLTSVKSKLLDFLLKLNEEIGDTEDIKSLTVGKAKEKVSSLFNSAVFGNNTTIIVGDHNTQTVSYITKGDFATLSNFLSESGIEKKDIDELKTVIDIDNPKAEKREFGNKVKLWVTKMIGKAMDNSWKIGLGAAGKLLADAIEIYYGWK